MKKIVIAGMVGNGLEWYDFALYGSMAITISELFFPKGDPTTNLIMTFGIFAAGFIMRPLGALFFGFLGDRYGRKVSLAASILLMAIPTGLIGILPTYAQIGVWAPILLMLMRLAQGAALGGEFSGSITYIVEHAPDNRRVLAGATALISMMFGILLGAGVAALFGNLLGKEAFDSWGWRMPFVIGFFIGIVGLYIRRYLDESPAYTEAKESGDISRTPVRELFTQHWKSILGATGLYMAVTIPFYMITVFMVPFMEKELGIKKSDALLLDTLSKLLILLVLPGAALLADSWGRKTILKYALIGMLLTAVPAFVLIATSDPYFIMLGLALFGVMLGFYIAPIPAVLVDMFPTRIRYTGMAVACNLCAAIFGGTTPALTTWLIGKTDSLLMPAVYISLSVVVSFVTLHRYRTHSCMGTRAV